MQRYLEKRNTKDEETEREHPFIRGHWSKQPFWDRSLSKLNSVRQVELCLFCAWTHVGEAESTIMNLSHWQEIPAQTTGPVTWLLVVFLSSSNLQLTLLHVHTQMIVFISSSLGQQKPLKWSCSVKWTEVAQSCPSLFDSMDSGLPGSAVHGILQARILEWAAISFSWGSSQPRDRTQVSCIADRPFTIRATREPHRNH